MKSLRVLGRGSCLAVLVATAWSATATAAVGDFDQAFAGSGYVFSAKLDGLTPVAVQPDDAVITADGRRAIVRYRSDGQIDESFGDGGRVRIALDGAKVMGVLDLAVDPQGRILVAAIVRERGSPNPYGRGDNVIARFSAQGQLDTTFGDAGFVRTGIIARDGFLTVDGEGGSFFSATADELLRLDPDGRPDPTFGVQGRVQQPGGLIGASAVRPDDSLLVGFRDALVELTPDGTVDASFGQNGSVDLGSQRLHTDDVALASDGTGYVQVADCFTGLDNSYGCEGSLLKVSPTGELDPSFSRSDAVDVNRSGTRAGLALDRDGTLVAARVHQARRDQRLAVSRFLPTGELDSSWARGGTAGAYPGGCLATPSDLAIDGQGRVVVGAVACGRQVVVRLSATPGAADADGDGVRDRRDRCKLFPGPRRDGCVGARRKLRLTRLSARGASGKVRSRADACLGAMKVRLVLRRSGRDKVVGRTTTRPFGSWRIDERLGSGAYSARASRQVGDSRASCAPAASRFRRLRG